MVIQLQTNQDKVITGTVTAGSLTKSEDNPSNNFCTMNPLSHRKSSYVHSHGNLHEFGCNTLGNRCCILEEQLLVVNIIMK